MKKVAKSGKRISIVLTKNENETEKLKILLVDAAAPSGFKGLTSINSPLGRCIYGKKEGFKGVYSVLNENIEVEILKIE